MFSPTAAYGNHLVFFRYFWRGFSAVVPVCDQYFFELWCSNFSSILNGEAGFIPSGLTDEV